jgi:calcineurin-like phosphoesterase family protein
MALTVKDLGTSKIWFTSDWHIDHINILKYCHRPFNTIEEMGHKLINNFNNMVSDNDVVYFLGDMVLKESTLKIFSYDMLHGNKIFIRGNHDCKSLRREAITQDVLTYNGQSLFLTHDPKNIGGKHDLNVVGHVHDLWKYNNIFNAVNVGVDVWDFKPVSLNNILKYLPVKKILGEYSNGRSM